MLRRDSAKTIGGQIEWLGPEYDPDRLAGLYGSMDIFCYPSLAEKGETFGAVSYTHLDVYKRQDVQCVENLSIYPRWEAIDDRLQCLEPRDFDRKQAPVRAAVFIPRPE